MILEGIGHETDTAILGKKETAAKEQWESDLNSKGWNWVKSLFGFGDGSTNQHQPPPPSTQAPSTPAPRQQTKDVHVTVGPITMNGVADESTF